jgi:glycosyltransferase involved in cell wall biosynthesis
MATTQLTVGIPTFNRSKLLAEAIESVLAQSFTNFRLIVSDNASDDDTPKVVESYGDQRVEYQRSDHNRGAIGNINRLIELAETEYLVLLPDDDLLYPGHLEATVGLLERFPTAGLAHSAYHLIDQHSRVVRRIDPCSTRSGVTLQPRDRALEQLMTSPGGLCFSSIAYRTRAIVDAGGFRADEEPFGDRQLWMRIALNWDFGYVATPLAGFRAHADTVSTNVAARHGVAVDGRDGGLLYAQLTFQRRIDFLADAPLERRQTKRLHALATLQLLVDRANAGLAPAEVAARLASVVRSYPRLLARPALWRLVLAELGGRRVRSALRGATIRYRDPQQS